MVHGLHDFVTTEWQPSEVQKLPPHTINTMLRTAFSRSPILRVNASRFSSNYVVLGSSSALKDIIAKDGSKILYFTATWCPPCKKIAPVFEKMSKDFAKTTFVKIDIDDHRDLAEQYNISSVPTFKAMAGSSVTSSVRSHASKCSIHNNFPFELTYLHKYRLLVPDPFCLPRAAVFRG